MYWFGKARYKIECDLFGLCFLSFRMKNLQDKKSLSLVILFCSVFFFALGFLFPLMQTGYGIGPFRLKTEYIYLSSSFKYFFDKGEMFIGSILLFFTIIFPVLKFIFLFITLSGKKLPKHQYMNTALEIINKWSMLDVFVVAILILNMKFDSDIIVSKLESGTTLFAISIVLMMTASFIAGKYIKKKA
jgi:paraquat-inducible protein A